VGKKSRELIILNCTIKTRRIYFCVSRLSKAQNWRIFKFFLARIRLEVEVGVAGASQRHQINLYTSCDVPATLNQLGTIVVGGSRSIFAPTLVSCPDQEPFPKMLPGRS